MINGMYLVFSAYEIITSIAIILLICYIGYDLYKKKDEVNLKYYDLYSYFGNLVITLIGSLVMIFIYLLLNSYAFHNTIVLKKCCDYI